ncbi:unnamed protein product [Ectocarpus fasciculatus]
MAADSGDAAAAAAKLALKMGSAAADTITFMADLGEELPFLRPVLKTLKAIRETVEDVTNNKEELQALHRRCVYLTACVVMKSRQSSCSEMDVTPLEECLEAAGAIVKRCGRRGKMKGMLKASSDKGEIARMKTDMRDLEADLSLAGVAILEGKTSDLTAMVERMRKSQAATQETILANTETIIDRLPKTPAKLARIPKGTPIRKSWHVERAHVMERVLEALTADGGPHLVGLVGDSGSGKTTVTSEIVRSTEVREAFSDGVVWLTVNHGAMVRLPSLMLQLAHMVYEEIGGRRPATTDDGAAYIKEQMQRGHGGKGLKCLVAADNVWETEVVWKLLETGMSVLLSTRDEALVTRRRGTVIGVDELSEVEAESVLRKASELPPETRLPDDAVDLIELCGRVAMDLAFVGRWSTVRVRSDRTAWSDAAGKVRAEMGKIEGESVSGKVVETRDARRKAVLQAGFEDLAIGSDDERVQRLYLSLAVLPDGRGFTVKHAAVLLYDRKPSPDDEVSAAGVVEILERWSVLRSARWKSLWQVSQYGTEQCYVMHDAHSGFARENLMDRGDVRRAALLRWTRYISSLDTLRSVRWHDLKDLWLGVEQVGGDSWKGTRPYEAALAGLEDSDPDLPRSVELVAKIQQEEEDWEGAAVTYRRLLDMEVTKLGPVSVEVVNSLHEVGLGFENIGRLEEAQEVLRGCLVIAEVLLGSTDVTVAQTLEYLSVSVRRARHFEEAEGLLRRCLAVREAKLGHDHTGETVRRLSNWLKETGRRVEAEELLTRRLEILEASVSPMNGSVDGALFDLGTCVQEGGRFKEAEGLFRRCLKYREVKLGRGSWVVEVVLYHLGICVLSAGRPTEAEKLLRWCLEILETGQGGQDHVVARRLFVLGACVRLAGRLGEAEELFRRGLEIEEDNVRPDHLEVAYGLRGLGMCLQKAGQLTEAEGLLRRSLRILEAKAEPEGLLRHSHFWILEAKAYIKGIHEANTLYRLGECVREAGRLGEAEELFRRCLEIAENKLGQTNMMVADTLHGLGVCVRRNGRLQEAAELLRRCLEVQQRATHGFYHGNVTKSCTLQELDLCVQEAIRPADAEDMSDTHGTE